MIQVPLSVVDAYVAHAISLAPIESCGYIAGNASQMTRYIEMTNVDHSPEHFSFDPKEQFQAMKSARAAGETLQVVVHSHPVTPARLSAEDIRLFNDPNMIYLIVSLKESVPAYNAFRVRKPVPGVVEIDSVPIRVI